MSRVVLALLAALLPAAEPAPPPKSSLPPGAVARFGSSRFRFDGWISDVCYSPDSRTLVTGGVHRSGPLEGKSQLLFWDAATGVKRYESEAEEGQLWNLVCAPDGRTVATYFGKKRFTLFDAATGKKLRHIGQNVHGSPAFSPDGKMLAGTVGNAIQLWEVDTGEEVALLEGHQGVVTWIVYSPDGRKLASVGNDHTLRVWDVATGDILFQQEDEDFRWSFVDFSADSRSVASAVLNANDRSGHLVVWDMASQDEVWRVPVEAGFQGFGFTADGKSVVVVGLNDTEVREAATGKRRRYFSLGGPTRMLRSWSLAPDGRSLALGASGSVVHQWDLATGKNKDDSPGHRYPLTAVAVAPDGRSVLTEDNSGALRIWDSATGREMRRLQRPNDSLLDPPFTTHGWSPYFCCTIADGKGLRLVEIETGRERRRFKDPIPPEVWYITLDFATPCLATSADGAVLTLASINDEGMREIGIWEAATGKKRKSLEKLPELLLAMTLSADGTQVAGASKESIQLWDAATGREGRRMPLDKEMTVRALQFSADGRRLLAIGPDTTLCVWETDTGRQVLFTRLEGESIVAAALSPDGRTVAVSLLTDRQGPSGVLLLETASGQERCRLEGHLHLPGMEVEFHQHGIAFTPDGRSLITIGADTTALVWSLPFRGGENSAPSRAADLEPLWDALADADAAKGYQSLAALVAAPNLTVPFLRERLRPVPPLDDKARADLARRLLDLDSDDFETREKAAAALERLQELAAPALRKTLASDPSPEVRRHVVQLLDKLATHPPAAETLRTIRAVETLERIGTPEAQKLLAELAKGAPAAWRTREASGSLARLKGRISKPRP